MKGYDEPEILQSSRRQFCLTGDDVGQFWAIAGQRGGGKTTLINMITLAVFGRRAAAASWSDKLEERKKSLFSYLRQSVACLVWDNILRGSAISCPHIEAALTAAEISDRVLGGSIFETVPSTTVQVFTGNSIVARGDMASRSLFMPLNVDRPDPENRAFAHDDPAGWTLMNRAKILRALYVLLIAGNSARPAGQIAKTRFKTWWKLVGWPVEYAARLCGISVDCTELMRTGEDGDEEASGAASALRLFMDVWGTGSFTSNDVLKAATFVRDDFARAELSETEIADKARADAIADALTELAGNRINKLTSHAIGKLFQKHLVGRPVRIGEGQAVVILRKTTAHNGNLYRVEVQEAPPPTA